MTSKFNGAIYSINAAALLIGAAGLLSRLLGIVRDRMLASHFGASRELDIYYAAFQIPDFFFTLFLLAAASSAIIPIFSEIREDGNRDAKKFISNLAGVFLIVSVTVALVAIALAPYLIRWVTPGFSSQERSLTITLMRIMMASPVFLGLSGIVSSVIQSYRRFFIFALSPIFYNLGILVGIIIFLPLWGLAGLAWGVILGAFLHLLVQIPSFRSLGFRFSLWKFNFDSDIRRVLAISFPRVLALSINTLSGIFLIAFASTLPSGSISIFQFANNLHFLPVGLFGVSFAVASFPAMSENYIRKNSAAFFDTFYETMRSILFWILPLAFFFYVLRAQIVRLALGAGKFDWSDTRLTAASLGILALSIVVESLNQILIRSFYAIDSTKKPLFINIGSALVTVLSAAGFIYFLGHTWVGSGFVLNILRVNGLDGVIVLGLAMAVTLGDTADFIFLLRGFLQEARLKLGSYVADKHHSDIAEMFFASILAGFASFGTLRLVNIFINIDTFTSVFIQGGLASFAGFVVYGGFLFYRKNREMLNMIETLKRRLVNLQVLPKELDGTNFR